MNIILKRNQIILCATSAIFSFGLAVSLFSPSEVAVGASLASNKQKNVSESLEEILVGVQKNALEISDIKSELNGQIDKIKLKVNALDLSGRAVSTFSPDIEEASEEGAVGQSSRDFADYMYEERTIYDNEVVDFSWAPKAESYLDGGLERFSEELHFELLGSECRTTRCVATVSFKNYDLAMEHGSRLAEVSFPGLNCAQSISLPEPNDSFGSYEANLNFDCTLQTQGLVQAIN